MEVSNSDDMTPQKEF